MKNSTLFVSRKVLPNGIKIICGRKKYNLVYPQSIWREFPDVYRQTFADSVTYFLTMHLTLTGNKKIVYDFPPPVTEPFFFKGMVYSLPETTLTESNSVNMNDLLKLLYNSNYQIEFTERPRYARFKNVNRNSKKRAIIPFSFGKDSLLTFAITKELGITPYPIFFREPRSPFENKHKYKLAQKFLEEFDVDVRFFPVTAGWLRQTTGYWWGWDLLLTEYTMLLIPFLFGLKSKYLFWGHEQSCNDWFVDEDGYRVNPVYEQSYNWLLTSNAAAKVLGSNAVFASLIEPVHEIAIMKILHTRYPEIGKYQMSCFAEDEISRNRRWCGVCSKCARMYIFFQALGISPKRAGFYENMLVAKKRHLFNIFSNDKVITDSAFAQSDIAKEEQLLAFYLAYKGGAKGQLIEEFKKKYLKEVKKRESYLREKFFGTHTTNTLTYELKKPVLKIFGEELKNLH